LAHHHVKLRFCWLALACCLQAVSGLHGNGASTSGVILRKSKNLGTNWIELHQVKIDNIAFSDFCSPAEEWHVVCGDLFALE